jgi:hypothetical protein
VVGLLRGDWGRHKMDDKVNFCNRCGTEVFLGSKFCSNCGAELMGVSNSKYDANIRVSTRNENIDSAVQAASRGLSFLFLPLHLTARSVKRVWRLVIKHQSRVLVGVFIVALAGAGVLLFDLVRERSYQASLEEERLRREQEINAAVYDLKLRITQAQDRPSEGRKWRIVGEQDPASNRTVGRLARIVSDDGLCRMDIGNLLGLTGRGIYVVCEFNIDAFPFSRAGLSSGAEYFPRTALIKFDFESKSRMVDILWLENRTRISIHFHENVLTNMRQLDSFTKDVASGKALAVELFPMAGGENLDPIWVRFSLEGAKEAIAKLGKEM